MLYVNGRRKRLWRKCSVSAWGSWETDCEVEVCLLEPEMKSAPALSPGGATRQERGLVAQGGADLLLILKQILSSGGSGLGGRAGLALQSCPALRGQAFTFLSLDFKSPRWLGISGGPLWRRTWPCTEGSSVSSRAAESWGGVWQHSLASTAFRFLGGATLLGIVGSTKLAFQISS